MTETAFYILLCLKAPNHGYGVVQKVEKLTGGAIRLPRAPCTAACQKWKRTALSVHPRGRKAQALPDHRPGDGGPPDRVPAHPAALSDRTGGNGMNIKRTVRFFTICDYEEEPGRTSGKCTVPAGNSCVSRGSASIILKPAPRRTWSTSWTSTRMAWPTGTST